MVGSLEDLEHPPPAISLAPFGRVRNKHEKMEENGVFWRGRQTTIAMSYLQQGPDAAGSAWLRTSVP